MTDPQKTCRLCILVTAIATAISLLIVAHHFTCGQQEPEVVVQTKYVEVEVVRESKAPPIESREEYIHTDPRLCGMRYMELGSVKFIVDHRNHIISMPFHWFKAEGGFLYGGIGGAVYKIGPFNAILNMNGAKNRTECTNLSDYEQMYGPDVAKDALFY